MTEKAITYFIRRVVGQRYELISQVIGESFGGSYETYFDNHVCSGSLVYCIEVKRRLEDGPRYLVEEICDVSS